MKTNEMKRRYEKPSMKVYPLQHRLQILCGSGEGPEFGYVPGGIGEDKKLMA